VELPSERQLALHPEDPGQSGLLERERELKTRLAAAYNRLL
jgi:hypothetical protein